MRFRKLLKVAACLLACVSTSSVAAAESNLPQWKALHYRLSLLFVSAEADIQVRKPDRDEVMSALINPAGLRVIRPGPEVYELLIKTDNLGRRSESRVWYTPDFKMLQMSRFDSGKRHRRKVFRYLQDGFWSFQRNPKNDEEADDESKWSEEATKVVHKPEALKSVSVIEDSLLFHMVATLPLRKKGDSYDYYSYINDAVFKNRLEVVGKRDVEVDYVEKYPGREKWVEGDTELVHIRVISQAVDAKNQDDFEIMGLKGALSLYVDAKTGVLVQLSGDVDYLGRVDITLYKVES